MNCRETGVIINVYIRTDTKRIDKGKSKSPVLEEVSVQSVSLIIVYGVDD